MHFKINLQTDEKARSKPGFYQLLPSLAEEAISSRKMDDIPKADAALANVSITIVARGTPKDCARIYRLPSTDEELRQKWLSLVPDPKAKPSQKKKAAQLPRKPPPNAPEHVQQSFLAASLLSDDKQAGTKDYPPVPDKEDLIGFVTAGNFNLGEGRPTAVGSVVLKKLVDGMSGKKSVDRLCIVRNAGETVGRLTKWEIV